MTIYNKVARPWGGYAILKKTRTFWIKKLFVNRHARLSLQSHRFRSEVWFVISGVIHAQVGNQIHRAKAGDIIYVPVNRKHRIFAVNDACVLEFAFGLVLEHDITRYEDDYGRVKPG
ncbi:MAG TPA: phosphomannose isomerase type II C-terminal cupin domain [Myxococcota bacterium]|nr:phosphomannose isomerase type II C-terminal cupin domain [Myxococcota bacterium]